jgi:hypothetical protein
VSRYNSRFKIILTHHMMNHRSWSMTEDDLDLWERALERHFSTMDTSPKMVDIANDITSKCPVIGPRYVMGVISLLVDMDLV